MSVSQIVLLVLALLILYLYIKKYLLAKNVKSYLPSEAAAKVKSGKAVFLDIRTTEERDLKKINNSFHIPLFQLKSRLNELQRYKDKEIICYCRSGSSSLNAASILQKEGFNAANLKGGMLRWR